MAVESATIAVKTYIMQWANNRYSHKGLLVRAAIKAGLRLTIQRLAQKFIVLLTSIRKL